MFQVFAKEVWASVGMFAAMVLSILSRIIIWIIYQNMIRETDNMSATKNKVLKQCKLKFANCYQLNRGVANVPVFVDKFLNKLSLGPMSLQTMYHLSGQLMLLAVFFAGVGVCKSIIAGRSFGDLLPYYIVSFLGLYVYFSVSAITDIKEKRRVLKTSLVDYLENHMVNKLGGVERDLAIVAPPISSDATKDRSSRQQQTAFGKSEEKELEELLKEFLT